MDSIKNNLTYDKMYYQIKHSLQVEAVEFLLSNGANVNARNRENRTALHLVSKSRNSNNEKIFKLLIQKGANFHAQDQWWRTPLIEAVCSDNSEVVRWLLKAGYAHKIFFPT